LAADYYNMGVCKYEALMFEQAMQDLKKSLDIMDYNNVPSTDDTRLRAATYYKKASDVIQQLQNPQKVHKKSNRYYHDDFSTDEL
jgi:Tfp pilus assembly protein PilF